MDELIAFLRRMLDDDERIAKDASGWPWAVDPGYPGSTWATLRDADGERLVNAYDEAEVLTVNAEHIARHDPKRVLADVAAKRAIVEAFEQREREGEQAQVFGYHATGLLIAMRHLASVYADHPSFKEEWRP